MFLFSIVHSFSFGKEAVIAVAAVCEVPSGPSMPWWVSGVLDLLSLEFWILQVWKSVNVQFWWSLCSLTSPFSCGSPLAPLVLLAFLSFRWPDHHSPGGYTFQANISMLIPETRSKRSGCPPPFPHKNLFTFKTSLLQKFNHRMQINHFSYIIFKYQCH